jgi:hypothetical protein
MAKKFTGEIELDIRRSKPDWEFFLDQKPPKDAPNGLFNQERRLAAVLARD